MNAMKLCECGGIYARKECGCGPFELGYRLCEQHRLTSGERAVIEAADDLIDGFMAGRLLHERDWPLCSRFRAAVEALRKSREPKPRYIVDESGCLYDTAGDIYCYVQFGARCHTKADTRAAARAMADALNAAEENK